MFNKDTRLFLPSTSQVAERGNLLKFEKLYRVAWFILELQLKTEDHFTAEFETGTLSKDVAWQPASGRDVLVVQQKNPSSYIRVQWVRKAWTLEENVWV